MLYLFDMMIMIIDIWNLNRYSHQVLKHWVKVIVKAITDSDSDMDYLLSKLKLRARLLISA